MIFADRLLIYIYPTLILNCFIFFRNSKHQIVWRLTLLDAEFLNYNGCTLMI